MQFFSFLIWLCVVLTLPTWTQQANADDAAVDSMTGVDTKPVMPKKSAASDPMKEPIPALSAEEKSDAEALIHQVVERVKQTQADEEASRPSAPADAIIINHIPEFIREELRNQIRAELRTDVVKDVLVQAKKERWGIPEALPGWVNKVSIKGDFRLRVQDDLFADENVAETYINILEVNAKGGFDKAGPKKYVNTTEDRLRLRARVRFGIDADITEGVKIGLGLSTGNQTDPVSTNQTLGTYSNRYQVVWDKAYIKYDNDNKDTRHGLTLLGGRMPNPWESTDLVWDNDLAFEGLAATYKYKLGGMGGNDDGKTNSSTVFFTLGAFSLQEVELSSRDKWLYGAQFGMAQSGSNQSKFKIALAYYYYDNISGVRNEIVESTDYDYTAPAYLQKGNALFNIRNSTDAQAQLWALAAKYHEVNLTMSYDLAHFSPLHVILGADVVKNLGYDRKEIESISLGVIERSQGSRVEIGPTDERTLGYQIGVTVGWPNVTVVGNWNASLYYKYLERDAVLDAFTDSDFHLGGTDAKGWILAGNYGLAANAWASVRWITADSIDGVRMGVDTLQVDINAKF